MFKLSETTISMDETTDSSSSTKDIWKTLDRNFTAQLPFIEATVDRWNERTQLGQPLKNKKSAFNATILQ